MKAGDWVIHDYEIAQVAAMEGSCVTEVSTGIFNTSGRDLLVFPLTLRTKVIAESIGEKADEIRDAEKGNKGLNWPDIHGALCGFCAEACQMPEGSDMSNFWVRVNAFVRPIIERLESMRREQVGGVRLFR